ncbi:MAG TPA: hypothetical protein VMG12_27920 [Polyangiaceae bacterium]|nr:hypothetical protein [Polyangiaceae bacterium]
MTPAELTACLDTLESFFARATPLTISIDTRGAPPPSARERQAIAARYRAWQREYPGQLAGLAVVLNSAIERGVFTAIIWAVGQGFPARAFGTPADAEAWLQAALKARDPARGGR